MEVHPKWAVSRSCPDRHKDCQWISKTVENGLIEAANIQDYGHLSPKIGVFCPANHQPVLLPHVARACEDENYWECTHDEEFSGDLTEQQLWWIQGLLVYILTIIREHLFIIIIDTSSAEKSAAENHGTKPEIPVPEASVMLPSEGIVPLVDTVLMCY